MKKISLIVCTLFFLCMAFSAHAFAYRIVTKDYESLPAVAPAHGHAKIQFKAYPVEENGWLVEATPIIINGPGYLLHHGILALMPTDESFCGQKLPGSLFWGAGREHETLFLPNGFNLPDKAYGIPVKKGQSIVFFNGAIMLYNPDKQDYPDVKFRVTAKFYIPGAGDPPLKDLKVIPLTLSKRPSIHAAQWCPQYKQQVKDYREKFVTMHPEEVIEGQFESTEMDKAEHVDMKNEEHSKHEHHEHDKMDEHSKHNKEGGHESVTYWIPANSTKIDRWMLPLELGTDMEIYAVVGHVHDYADYIKLYNNDKEVWSAPLVKDEAGHVVAIPLHLKPGLKFKSGDKINLETKYTNPYHVPVDAMGIVVLLVHQETKGPLVVLPEKLPLKELDVKEVKKTQNGR